MMCAEQFSVAEDNSSVIAEIVGLACGVQSLLVCKTSYEVRMVRGLERLGL